MQGAPVAPEEVLVVGYDPEGEPSRWPVVARVSPHIAVLRARPEELAECVDTLFQDKRGHRGGNES